MGDNSPLLTHTHPRSSSPDRNASEVEMARPEGWLLTLLVVGFILLSARWHRPTPAASRVQPNARPTPRPLKLRAPRTVLLVASPIRASGPHRHLQSHILR